MFSSMIIYPFNRDSVMVNQFVLGRRRLQMLNGHGGYINAPASWIRHNGLSAGDTVVVSLDSEGRLVISPEATL